MVDDDPYDLNRFVAAQADCYPEVVRELRAGVKQSHWMWFVFPQLAGLGHSARARRYGVTSLAEARDYLRHPLLGPRLAECTQLVLDVEGRTAEQIFGTIDAVKLRSSMTMFHRADRAQPAFHEVLVRYFDGRADEATDNLLAT